MRKRIPILIAFTLSTAALSAQTEWTLEKCIDYAIAHNLSIKQQEITQAQNKLDLQTARLSRLPNLNGGAGQSFSFGRGLQADNTYADRNTSSSSFSLSTSIPLFTGLQIPNNIALSKLNLQASIEDLNKAKEDIGIQVTSSYLQILFNQELVNVARQQVLLSKEQYRQKEAYFNNGKIAEVELYEAQSRVAQDELSAVQANNNYQLSLLDLSQLLELPTPEGMTIQNPDTTIQFHPLGTPESIYNESVLERPGIKAAQYRLQGASKSIRIAQSSWYPRIDFSAGMGSSYYHMNEFENQSFSTQWRQNFSKSVSFSLNVPIFNRFETRNRVKQARLQQTSLEWRLDDAKKSLYKEIQQAYYNAVASEEKYKSSLVATEASEASFRLTTKKYDLDQVTATQYNEVRTNWLRALSDCIQAKYEYIFRTKILAFYRGVPLTL